MLLDSCGNLRPQHGKADHRRALQNPAVAHCQQTWERVYRSVLKYRKSKALALFDAGVAFREAMPLLAGHENISDFIACVTYGMENLVLMEDTGTKLLYAAQVALSANRRTKRSKKTSQSDLKAIDTLPLHHNSEKTPPLATTNENKRLIRINRENKGLAGAESSQKQPETAIF